jgi:pyruvate carboxylase
MHTMRKSLALNRGEIAIRIFRAASETELKTVATYSQGDRLTPGVLPTSAREPGSSLGWTVGFPTRARR